MNEIDLLSHVYQTAEMGQDGITSVLRYSRDPSLRKALERQKREYRELQASAGDMLRSRGVQPDGVGAAAKLSSELMSAMKTLVDHSSTKIAEMMIQGSTMGVTKSLRTLRDCRPEEPRVKDLADKLLKTEQANIEEMKTFL